MMDLQDLEWLITGFKFKAKELEYEVLNTATKIDAMADVAEITLIVRELFDHDPPADLGISVGDTVTAGDNLR